MKILFLTNYYREGPSSRYRSFNYKNFFEKMGIETDYKPLMYEGYVKSLYTGIKNSTLKKVICIIKRMLFVIFRKKKYDHIVIETELVKYLPYFIEKMLLKNISYSLDFDDNPKLQYVNSKIYRNKIENLCNKAKFVTVGNSWYFKELKGENLEYLPTVIDIEKYNKKENYKNDKSIRIVWIGSKSTEFYLKIIQGVIVELSKKHNIIFKIIGGNLENSKINIEAVEWREETEVKNILESDIGIMPLNDTYLEKGKCGFKLIQYMACGLPVVASPAPANKEIILNNENGFIAYNENEWFYYLEKLIENADLRERLGNNARKRVEEYYCYQVWTEKYIELLKKNYPKNRRKIKN